MWPVRSISSTPNGKKTKKLITSSQSLFSLNDPKMHTRTHALKACTQRIQHPQEIGPRGNSILIL